MKFFLSARFVLAVGAVLILGWAAFMGYGLYLHHLDQEAFEARVARDVAQRERERHENDLLVIQHQQAVLAQQQLDAQIQANNRAREAEELRQYKLRQDQEATLRILEAKRKQQELDTQNAIKHGYEISEEQAQDLTELLQASFNHDGTPIQTSRKTYDEVYPIYNEVSSFLLLTIPAYRGPNYQALQQAQLSVAPIMKDAEHKRTIWLAYVAKLNDPVLKAQEDKRNAEAKAKNAADIQALETKMRERAQARQKQQWIHDAAQNQAEGSLGTSRPAQIP